MSIDDCGNVKMISGWFEPKIWGIQSIGTAGFLSFVLSRFCGRLYDGLVCIASEMWHGIGIRK